ncbi:DUF4382 domain-containing protein [Neolewinella aurantiaca]|uniref:DUF4382 domain-containing protein n=1 Tax=Neolewinella aurantiaca TaxID=2602767 RepID=A0A5C7FNB9_9BACT|nr:DUF4382 domain-containing protein [Neolewinella aurantiaca]TXF87862.1 DUF4382 domain-containing protein [Neolewinella aurantiaca]
MTFNYLTLRSLALLLLVSVCFACEDDDSTTPSASGSFTLEITDAPIDDADVSAVFVTIADVKVDGASIEGFSRTTVELSALQNGVTELIASADLEARTYNTIEVVLDDAQDASGNAPGCYVRRTDGTTVALDVDGDGSLTVSDASFTVNQGATVAAVIDFDLRKAIQRGESATEPYRFAAEARLESSLRFVEKELTGTLQGTVSNASGEDGEVVIYAYAAGTYQASEAEGEENETFLNAVSSTRLTAGGSYTLAFLESGSYELVAVSYQDEDNDGELELAGQFELNAALGINLGGLSVDATSLTTANFTLSTLLP